MCVCVLRPPLGVFRRTELHEVTLWKDNLFKDVVDNGTSE